MIPSFDLAYKLIAEQFPEYANLPITDVEKQGHDNRTYRLGDHLLIRMPTAADYAAKVAIEQDILPQLARNISLSIPAPIKMGKPSAGYPYPFSIYKWLPGKSINLLTLTDQDKEQLAFDLAQFLKELQAITHFKGLPIFAETLACLRPGQHNWWRGGPVSFYDKGAREQIAELAGVIDLNRAFAVWEKACATQWHRKPVWIHGDLTIGNLLMESRDDSSYFAALAELRREQASSVKLSAVIDFGGAAVGDPACDLVIAWTYLSGKSREIFMSEMDLDHDTWLRARAWALWKATYELCHIADKNSAEGLLQKRIVNEVIEGL